MQAINSPYQMTIYVYEFTKRQTLTIAGLCPLQVCLMMIITGILWQSMVRLVKMIYSVGILSLTEDQMKLPSLYFLLFGIGTPGYGGVLMRYAQ